MSTKDTPKDTNEIADLIDKLAGLDIKDPLYPAMYFHIIICAPQMMPFLQSPQHTQLKFQLVPIPQAQFWPQPQQPQHFRPLTATCVIFVEKQGMAFTGVSSVRT